MQNKLYQHGISSEKVNVRLHFKRRQGGLKLIKSVTVDLKSSVQGPTIALDITDYISRKMSRPIYPHPNFILSVKSEYGLLPASILMDKGCTTPFLVVTTAEVGDTDIVKEMAEHTGMLTALSPGDRPWPGDSTLRTKRRSGNKWPTPLLYKDVTNLEKEAYNCRRQDLWINFDEIGWNFVITPKNVNIGDCGGKCAEADNNIAHAVVKQLLQNINPSRNAGILCCQGASYKEITALYFKSKHEIVIGSMPRIVVDKCRCR